MVGDPILTVETNDILLEGDYEISIAIDHIDVGNTPSPSPVSPLIFTVRMIDNPCVEDLIAPSANDLDSRVIGM